MTDYLQFTIDKFTFQVATDRFYSKEGVWAKMEDGRIRRLPTAGEWRCRICRTPSRWQQPLL